MSKQSLSCIILALLVGAALAQEKAEGSAYTTLEPEEFAKRMKEAKPADVIVLDVRTPEEYKAGHLKDAVLIDYRAKDFDQKIKVLDKSKTYFVYCASGYRSSSACRKLQALDFANLYNLKGGITAWQKAGKPTTEHKE